MAIKDIVRFIGIKIYASIRAKIAPNKESGPTVKVIFTLRPLSKLSKCSALGYSLTQRIGRALARCIERDVFIAFHVRVSLLRSKYRALALAPSTVDVQ